ncbi:MAG: formylglycine-generating enzyme family protein [Magnetococcus sp. YQC-3]
MDIRRPDSITSPWSWICPVTGMEFVKVPAGAFLLGSPEHEVGRSKCEGPRQHVELDEFWLGKYPVTQGEYEQVMGSNPSRFKGIRHPVEGVSWYDAQEFIRELNRRGNRHYRLPTEAEWEYACRAGSEGRWCFGSDRKLLEEYAWFDENSEEGTHPVGGKKPNAFGLHDMHGNVWEWMGTAFVIYDDSREKFAKMYARQNEEEIINLVARGGCWSWGSDETRSAYRLHGMPPNLRSNLPLGFRIVMVP